MPPPTPTSLKAFLSAARKALASPPSQRPAPLTFVVGNESADLDSLCCALLLAYLRSHAAPPHEPPHIPLSNLPRADLALRPELNAVLGRAGLKGSDLLTLSELPSPQDLDPTRTRWLLVDHNALTGVLEGPYAGRVVGCIDHHEDEGKVPPRDPDGGGAPRVIEKTGSCMSLVVECCRDVWEKVAARATSEAKGEEEDGAGADLDAQLAHIALGPILIDTTNLTSKDKTTEKDIRAVEFAEARMGTAEAYDRAAYFEEVSRLKNDLSRLSYRDIFRKDYKQWTDGGLVLGMSSVAQGLNYLFDKIGDEEALRRELRRFAEEKRLDIAAVMTVTHEGGRFGRELLVWALNPDAARAVEAFVARSGGDLGLEELEREGLRAEKADDQWRACWRQGQTKYSRKQVAPMLRSAMKEAPKL
ncbi:Exopolyphosphatase [Pleurostoma richardsiae]|uniref:Exopolyphosphatase n=1 Tax=Pleurostoma richardsiae TaxID=41990 RepID=A0AA38VL33_9PEZI|nr:Exopolyphosphatase [Pleurostoma richardsiae]